MRPAPWSAGCRCAWNARWGLVPSWARAAFPDDAAPAVMPAAGAGWAVVGVGSGRAVGLAASAPGGDRVGWGRVRGLAVGVRGAVVWGRVMVPAVRGAAPAVPAGEPDLGRVAGPVTGSAADLY